MTEPDPLVALRADATPVAPDPAWASRLRARLEDALTRPEEPMTATTTVEQTRPVAWAQLTPYLAVGDARAAIDWYAAAFGAVVSYDPIVMEDGRVGHAELRIGPAQLFLSDAHPEIGVVAPTAGASAVTLHLSVPDVDRLVAAADDQGGTVERPPADTPYGRQAVLIDPFGHRWMLMSPPPMPDPIREGDLAYASLQVPDADRAMAFYAAVLGWQQESAPARTSLQVGGLSMHLGIVGRQETPTLFCCYAVADLEAGRERVVAAGGDAEPVETAPHGRTAMCRDPQGRVFALWEIIPGAPRPPTNGARAGDLAYVTMQVVGESGPAREFYRAVLGWEFTPGRVDDGWGPVDVAPMTGLSGGHDTGQTVPMWRVDDVDAAVDRVRAAGGRAEDPEDQPYGRSSVCVDDQGMPFYLGQL